MANSAPWSSQFPRSLTGENWDQPTTIGFQVLLPHFSVGPGLIGNCSLFLSRFYFRLLKRKVHYVRACMCVWMGRWCLSRVCVCVYVCGLDKEIWRNELKFINIIKTKKTGKMKRMTHLCIIINVGASFNQQFGNIQITIMCGNMQRSESTLWI